jgi:penicillin-insensitive murein endopeptidase
MSRIKILLNPLVLIIFLFSVSLNVNAGLFKKAHKGSESVGNYWNGSLKNAVGLKEKGNGYQVVRLSRKRYYGHNDLVSFIEELGNKSHKNKLGVFLVGDMAKEKGGRIPGSHHSHQTGLDADIFLNLQKNYLNTAQRESRGPQSVVSRGRVNPKQWTPAHSKLLRMVSEDDRVERVFVNYAIKKHLCQLHKKEAWLSKIRPMGGHTGHFHVRLACPSNSPNCRPQGKPPANSC